MTDEATQKQESQEPEKAHDYDQKYAFDANSGLAPQPGGAVLASEGEKTLLVDSEGALKAVEGDVTSKAQAARIDAQAQGKSPEETDKAVAETEGATDEATKDSGDVSGIVSGAGYGEGATGAEEAHSKPEGSTTKASTTRASAKK